MNTSREQLFAYINSHNFRWIKILDSDNDKAFQYQIQKDSTKTLDDLKRELELFLNQCSGESFKIQCKINPSDANEDIFLYKYSCKENFTRKESKQDDFNITEIEARVKAKILAEFESVKEKQVLTDLKKELEEQKKSLEQWAGKAQMIFELVLGKLVDKYQPMLQGLFTNQMKTQLAGTTNTQNTDMQELTEDEKTTLTNSITVLLNYLTVSEIETLSKKVRETPSLIETLRTFKLI